MDCRRTLVLAVGLAGGCLGCVGPGRNALPGAVEVSTSKKPHASTEVAYGTFRVREAADPHLTRAQKEDLWEQARHAFQNALKLDPDCSAAWDGLGNLYTTMADYDRAVKAFQQGLAKHPKEAALWFDLGVCQCRRKDWPAALDCLQKAHGLDLENRFYTKTLGLALPFGGRYGEGLACLKLVMPEAEAHYNLAGILHHLGREEQSKEQLQIALRLAPNLAGARDMYTRLEAGDDGGIRPVVNLGFLTGDLPASDPTR
jgi:tetratricopeptide (TPR) repeat protein